MDKFDEALIFGKIAESDIANWVKRKGWNVLPVYEKEINEGKGPQLFIYDGRELIAPDLFIFKSCTKDALWIEAKHKKVFTWYRKHQQWTTGIDLRHYEDYIKLGNLSPWPVWILFLHQNNRDNSRNEPWPCPVGLFGQKLDILQKTEDHRSDKWAKGMVYWSHKDLIFLATLADVIGR